jgi:hypothetical protein
LIAIRSDAAGGGKFSMGVIMKHRGGADDAGSAPKSIMRGPDQQSPDAIGAALRAFVLGARS